MKTTFFHKQNNILKLIFLLLGFFLVFILKPINIVFLILINFFYFLPVRSILKFFWFVFFRLSYFFILFLLICLMCNISFVIQIEYLIKAIFILQLIIYFYKSYVNKIACQDAFKISFFSLPNLYLFYILTVYTLILSI